MEWNEHSDDLLIGYAASHLQHQGPAAMEMQRRLLVAIREFNAASGQQAATMIRLNKAITVLTVALFLIAGVQLWAMFRPVGAAAANPQGPPAGQVAQGSAAQDRPDQKGWFVESFEGGVITTRHEGNTYRATCRDSSSYNNAASITDPKNVVQFRTCDLAVSLVGHLVQPFEGKQTDSDGKVVIMFNVGDTLAIRSWKDEHTPWRMDQFTVTSVIAKR